MLQACSGERAEYLKSGNPRTHRAAQVREEKYQQYSRGRISIPAPERRDIQSQALKV